MRKATRLLPKFLPTLTGASCFAVGATCLGTGLTLFATGMLPLEAISLVAISLPWFVFGEQCYQCNDSKNNSLST